MHEEAQSSRIKLMLLDVGEPGRSTRVARVPGVSRIAGSSAVHIVANWNSGQRASRCGILFGPPGRGSALVSRRARRSSRRARTGTWVLVVFGACEHPDADGREAGH